MCDFTEDEKTSLIAISKNKSWGLQALRAIKAGFIKSMDYARAAYVRDLEKQMLAETGKATVVLLFEQGVGEPDRFHSAYASDQGATDMVIAIHNQMKSIGTAGDNHQCIQDSDGWTYILSEHVTLILRYVEIHP